MAHDWNEIEEAAEARAEARASTNLFVTPSRPIPDRSIPPPIAPVPTSHGPPLSPSRSPFRSVPSPSPAPTETPDVTLQDPGFGYQDLPENALNEHRLHDQDGLHDFLPLWPEPIPPVLKNAPLSGELSGLISDQSTADLSFLERFIYTVALTLDSVGVARDKTEYALKAMNTVAQLTQIKARKDCTCNNHQEIISDSPAETLATARRRLAVELPTIAHPCCPNPACREVVYERTNMSTSKLVLNQLTKCPRCELDWSPITGQMPSTFPRLPLVSEIERVLSYPGVEQVAFNWRERRRINTQLSERLYPGLKIYRDQTDGTMIDSLLNPAGLRVDQTENDGIQEIFLNLSIDWLNQRSSSFAPGYSVGPILVQMANLPQESRALQAMIMCVGMTPGKILPCGSNIDLMLIV
jgi:hypothetical protein